MGCINTNLFTRKLATANPLLIPAATLRERERGGGGEFIFQAHLHVYHHLNDQNVFTQHLVHVYHHLNDQNVFTQHLVHVYHRSKSNLRKCIHSQSPAWSERNRGHRGRRNTLQTEISLETSRELDWICLALEGISRSQPTTPPLVREVWSKEDLCFHTLEVTNIFLLNSMTYMYR